jgi:hypothetical protein
MKSIDPGRGGSDCERLTGEALERHLFACADCRGRARLAAVWDTLRDERPADATDAPAEERFVAGVLAAVRRDGSRRRRQRLWLAAAAVLLFFFAAGANLADRSAAPASPEEEYAGLTAPSALDGLLPE